MSACFDLFRQEDDGTVLWIGIATTLEEAERKIASANETLSATYLIVTSKTGDKKVVPSKHKSAGGHDWLNCRSAFA